MPEGVCASAAVAAIRPGRDGSSAAVDSSARRLMRGKERVGFMFGPLLIVAFPVHLHLHGLVDREATRLLPRRELVGKMPLPNHDLSGRRVSSLPRDPQPIAHVTACLLRQYLWLRRHVQLLRS